MDTTRRRGPRPRGPYTDKRKTLTTRITEQTRIRLAASATANDRSLSQEIELRLDRSLLGERHLEEALELAFGRSTAALTLICGFAIRDAAASHISPLRVWERPWISVPIVFKQAVAAVEFVLKAIDPSPDRAQPVIAVLHGDNLADALTRIEALRAASPDHAQPAMDTLTEDAGDNMALAMQRAEDLRAGTEAQITSIQVCRAIAFPKDGGPLGSWASVIHDWLGAEAVEQIKKYLREIEQ